jgi:hypothetical protein
MCRSVDRYVSDLEGTDLAQDILTEPMILDDSNDRAKRHCDHPVPCIQVAKFPMSGKVN